ncbi:purine and uridine phosphorylase [Macroventuria anomochaeta]|uniref:Purine and uridine phosphorylase n=1 Tax=Macroventuria anomochaeta TaxID=301207 RepID=A0ACB6SDX8_9PLEO|nr:purine and uridine phosphorylase [Macroventuria anomochaeta]KAF2632495.1 purine and uridine phosphorylase [Macroventuria anomochaeta]
MTRRRLGAAAYTVVWICALPVELAAAQVMLDEEHLPHDDVSSTQYTLGRIGSHNVVLACLPAGQMGIGAAAFNAGQAMSNFTSIRFGLMVGIGGGAPSAEADVRLGDVVVSQPVRQHSGVVQYDFGKTGQGGQMTRTGSLNAPPKVLLHAVAQLRAHHYQGRDRLATHLSTFDQRPYFSREKAGPDVLFEATYHHDGGATCERCSKDHVIHRTARRADEEVTIHYGTIASGNQVIKDGATRDRLSEELGGVLCFEMEAAGLMNDFPCLVMRGICDYADSHKNKAWQPYAAATAAACAKVILSLIPAAEVVKTAAVGEACKYRVPFNLKGVPVGKFTERLRDTQALERALLPHEGTKERRLLVAYGLGGMGKTQLAANFARRQQHSFSSVLWLDGSSESSLKLSFAAFASRIPAGQIAEASRLYAAGQGGDVGVVVRDVLGWLSIADNSDWLLIVDNVDRDDQRREEDAEAYDIGEYVPEADHGSVLITTRLWHLGQLGERWEVRKVDKGQAQAIFKTWYGRGVGDDANTITGQEGDELLGLLDGLPLALAQAAAYMSETGTSFSTYTRLYREQWRELMEPHDGRRMPLRSYANGSVATTWTISYMAVKARNKAAANLLLLWAHLGNKSLWYGLLAAASQKSAVAAERTAAWLGEMARSEVEFFNAIGMLRSYSLVEAGDQTGHSTHPVVHQWALHMQDDRQRTALSWLAVVLVGLAVPMDTEKKYRETQARLLPHAERCEKSIEGAALGAEHTSTLNTVNNLGLLYSDQGKLDEAEKMYMQALEGYEKAVGQEAISTFRPALNAMWDLGSLFDRQRRVEDAILLYAKALAGYQQVVGDDHASLQALRDALAALAPKEDVTRAGTERVS